MTCVDGESLRLKPVLGGSGNADDALVERLRKKISGLEAIIHAGLPEVDLSQDPLLIAAQLAARTDTTNNNAAGDDNASGPWTGATTTTLAAGTVSDTGNDGLAMVDDGHQQHQHTSAENVPVVRTAPPPAPPPHRRGDGHDSNMSQIGLVSVGTSSDPHYIGPSSGYFLARMLLSPPSKRHRSIYGLGSLYGPTHGDGPMYQSNVNSHSNSSSGSGSTSPSPTPYEEPPAISYLFPVELVEAMQAPLPLPSREHCNQLCDVFFDVVNIVYPVLHRPSFARTLD